MTYRSTKGGFVGGPTGGLGTCQVAGAFPSPALTEP